MDRGGYPLIAQNRPPTYVGIYQPEPILTLDNCLHPSNGRDYYQDRGMFELSQSPGYGPMFISKLWYDGPTRREYSACPWQTFNRIDSYPDRTVGDVCAHDDAERDLGFRELPGRSRARRRRVFGGLISRFTVHVRP